MKLLWQTGCERSGNKASVSHYIVAAMAALGHYQSPFFPSLLSLERTVVSRGFAAGRLLDPMCAADHRRRKRLLALFGSISWKLRREELIREAWVSRVNLSREPLSNVASPQSHAYLLTHARYPHPSSSNGPLCSQGIVQDYSCRGEEVVDGDEDTIRILFAGYPVPLTGGLRLTVLAFFFPLVNKTRINNLRINSGQHMRKMCQVRFCAFFKLVFTNPWS